MRWQRRIGLRRGVGIGKRAARGHMVTWSLGTRGLNGVKACPRGGRFLRYEHRDVLGKRGLTSLNGRQGGWGAPKDGQLLCNNSLASLRISVTMASIARW